MTTLTLLVALTLLAPALGGPGEVVPGSPTVLRDEVCDGWADIEWTLRRRRCAGLLEARTRQACLRDAEVARQEIRLLCQAEMSAGAGLRGGVILEVEDPFPGTGAELGLTIPSDVDLRTIRILDLSRGLRIGITLPAPGEAGDGEVTVESLEP